MSCVFPLTFSPWRGTIADISEKTTSLPMAEAETEGSGLVEEQESLKQIQHWDEDVVDLELKSGHYHYQDLYSLNINQHESIFIRWNLMSIFKNSREFYF